MARGNFDHMRQMFADQFERNNQGYLYRKSLRGAPFQVTTAERDRYVDKYNRYTKIAAWVLGAAVIAVTLLASFYSMKAGAIFSPVPIYFSVGVITALFVAGHYWSWNLPERELRGRGTLGQAFPRAQARQLFLEKISYGQIALAACAGVALLLETPGDGKMLSGWHIIPTVLSAILFAGCAIMAFQKWCIGSRP